MGQARWLGRTRRLTALADLIARSSPMPDMPLVVAACDRSGQIEEAASGVWPDGKPVRATDRFYGASLAKQITGAAAALLVREGRLDPDLPVAHYLADLPDWAGEVTTRDLAHHTAGLPPAGAVEPADEHWTEAFAFAALQRLPALASPPRTGYLYSNLGYILLAHLVARAAGRPFSDFARIRLFDPLGLDSMGFVEGDIRRFPQAGLMGPSLPLTLGDGGLWSTARAFTKWLHHQNRDALGIADIVTAAGRLARGDTVDYGWGLGLRTRNGHPLLIHGGEWTGVSAKAVRSPGTGVAVVVMSGGMPMEEINMIIEAVLDAAGRC